eukprot:360864-Chlamydomonas_euryale.AAC.2
MEWWTSTIAGRWNGGQAGLQGDKMVDKHDCRAMEWWTSGIAGRWNGGQARLQGDGMVNGMVDKHDCRAP